jgi:hypothetical protein
MTKAISIVCALAAGAFSLRAAWFWWKASTIDPWIPEVSYDDNPQVHILSQLNAALHASALNANAAKAAFPAAILGALASVLSAL